MTRKPGGIDRPDIRFPLLLSGLLFLLLVGEPPLKVLASPLQEEPPAKNSIESLLALEALNRESSSDLPMDHPARILPHYLEAIGPDPDLRESARKAIVWHGESFPKQLLERVADSGTDREYAILALVYAGNKKIRKYFTRLLTSKDPVVVANALEAGALLRWIAWRKVLKHLGDSDRRVALSAARALGKNESRYLQKALLKYQKKWKKNRETTAICAAYASALSKETGGMEILGEAMESGEQDFEVRAYSALVHLQALGKPGVPGKIMEVASNSIATSPRYPEELRKTAFFRIPRAAGFWGKEGFALLVHKDPLFRAGTLQAMRSKDLGILRIDFLSRLIDLLQKNSPDIAGVPSPRSSSNTMMEEVEVLVREIAGSRPGFADRLKRIDRYKKKLPELSLVFLSEDVNRAIERGVSWLKETQDSNGSWHYEHDKEDCPGLTTACQGATALAVYALLESGGDVQDVAIRNGLDLLLDVRVPDRKDSRRALPEIGSVYTDSITCMAFSAALHDLDRSKKRKSTTGEFRKTLRANLEILAGRLVASQGSTGAWSYQTFSRKSTSNPRFRLRSSYDHSNTQFALLGLASAAGAGVSIPKNTWGRILEHLRKSRQEDGGWSYSGRKQYRSTESMTSAGVGGMILALQALQPKISGEEIRANSGVAGGLKWMVKEYSLNESRRGPVLGRLNRGGWGFYYSAYSLERAMMLSEIKLLDGKYDWYRDGSNRLLRMQGLDGAWSSTVDTAFALLFLKRSFVTGR